MSVLGPLSVGTSSVDSGRVTVPLPVVGAWAPSFAVVVGAVSEASSPGASGAAAAGSDLRVVPRFFLRMRPVLVALSGISPVDLRLIRPDFSASVGISPVARLRVPMRPLRPAWESSSPVLRRFFFRGPSPVLETRVPSGRRRFFLRVGFSSTWRTVSSSSASTSRLVRSIASSSSMGGGASSTGLGGGGEGTNSRILNR